MGNPEELEELGLSSWLTSRKRFSRTKKRSKAKGAAPADAAAESNNAAKGSRKQRESKKLEPEVVDELLGEANPAGDDNYDDDFGDEANAGSGEAGPAPDDGNAKDSGDKGPGKDQKVD